MPTSAEFSGESGVIGSVVMSQLGRSPSKSLPMDIVHFPHGSFGSLVGFPAFGMHTVFIARPRFDPAQQVGDKFVSVGFQRVFRASRMMFCDDLLPVSAPVLALARRTSRWTRQSPVVGFQCIHSFIDRDSVSHLWRWR